MMAGKPDMTSQQFRERGLQLRTRSAMTDYKQSLLEQIRGAELPQPKSELKFNEDRKWRFDFYYENPKIAIEYEGGIFDKGASGHSSVSGIMRDIEKYNEAALAGWTVIRVTAQSVASGAAIRYIKKALEKKKSDIIPDDEKSFAQREWRTLVRRVRDYEQRYGFKLGLD
jgi:very-short-patch-repair endonuclease